MGLHASSFRVRFDPPATGGITMQLAFGEQVFGDNFSHIYPSLQDLCAALWEAGKRIPARPVSFLLEPTELDLRIEPVDEAGSELTVRPFPGRARSRQRTPVFAVRMPTRELVMTFWRALRRLQTSLPTPEFEREWRGPFPEAEMAALTSLVSTWKRGEPSEPAG